MRHRPVTFLGDGLLRLQFAPQRRDFHFESETPPTNPQAPAERSDAQAKQEAHAEQYEQPEVVGDVIDEQYGDVDDLSPGAISRRSFR